MTDLAYEEWFVWESDLSVPRYKFWANNNGWVVEPDNGWGIGKGGKVQEDCVTLNCKKDFNSTGWFDMACRDSYIFTYDVNALYYSEVHALCQKYA